MAAGKGPYLLAKLRIGSSVLLAAVFPFIPLFLAMNNFPNCLSI